MLKSKFFTRALSLLLALVCVLGVLPLSAFAASGLSSAPGLSLIHISEPTRLL